MKGMGHAEGLGIDERIILEWILGKWREKVWAGFIWLRIGTNGGHYNKLTAKSNNKI
jgi:hypothetical protein